MVLFNQVSVFAPKCGWLGFVVRVSFYVCGPSLELGRFITGCVRSRRLAGLSASCSRVLGTGGMGPKRMWRNGCLGDAWGIALGTIKGAHGADGSEWFLTLRNLGWEGFPERLCELCSFLMAQRLNAWTMLEFTDDPGHWAPGFSHAELAGLRSLREKAMRRLRCAQCSPYAFGIGVFCVSVRRRRRRQALRQSVAGLSYAIRVRVRQLQEVL